MANLSDADKERTRYHLGYLETSLAASIQLGIPKPLQTVFIVEDAMTLLNSDLVVRRVQCILDTMDKIESQLRSAIGTLAIDSVDKIQFHPLRSQGKLFTDSLEKEYTRWAYRLADVLGVPLYPYSARFKRSGPGSNVPVSN